MGLYDPATLARWPVTGPAGARPRCAALSRSRDWPGGGASALGRDAPRADYGRATLLAGGMDYVFQVFTGRQLAPAEYGVFIAVTALLQVVVYLTNSIRNVVAFLHGGADHR